MDKGRDKQVVEEWVKGKYPKHFEVIDIGAGSTPVPGATRAIDVDSRLFTKKGQLRRRVEVPKTLKEYIISSADGVPYTDEFFDRGISRWGIGARIKGIKPIRELFRVLKKDGEIYIAILEEDKETIPITKKLLRKVGFKIIDIYIGEYSRVGESRKEIKIIEYILHAGK